MPALLDDDGHTIAWDSIPLQQLPRLVSTHRAVCWDCHVAATSLRQHAEQVA
jgi:hypothetical protein